MFNDIQNNNMYFGQTADNFNASSNCPNPYQGFDPNSRRYGYGDVNRCLSQSEANYVSTPIPTYPLENPDSRRHDKGNGKGDEIIHKRSYYNNDGIHCCLIEESSNGKAKITPLAFAFSIGCVTYIREYGETPIKYVLIAGGTERPYSSIITYEDYINERFYQNMKWVRRCPSRTKKQVNDLIYDQIQKAPKSEAKIYSRQGFVKVGDNDYSFGSYPEDMEAYAEIMSDSVKMKKLIPIYREAQEIVQKWLDIYASHPTLKFLGLISIAAKLKFILEENEVSFKPIITVSPSAELDEEKLKAMLYSFDIKNYPVPSLALSEKGLLSYLKNIWDSLAVFSDNSFSDEAATIEEPLRTLIKASRGDYGEANTGRNIIAVISKNAGYIAHRISPESVIPLSMEGITLNYSSAHISEVTSEMESLVVKHTLNRLSEIRSIAAYVINQKNKFCSDKYQTAEAMTITVCLMVAEMFLQQIFGVNLATSEEIIQWVQGIDTQRNALIDSDTAIICDFSKVASKHFRSGSFNAIRKKNGMIVNDTSNTAIISGNRVYLTGKMIAEILSQMATTHNMKALLNALAHYNALDARDGRTHPLDAHNSSGEAVRVYLYDISADIFDADIIFIFNNLESEPYMLSEQEIPRKPFLQILRDVNGRVAGKIIDYTEENNDHTLICGQSGFGKTFLQSQLIAKRCSLGKRVVAFDTSDSFTYKALCHNLSKRFVDENVSFYNIDRSVIPIDIFRVDDNLSTASKIKYLVGVFKAGIGELSIPQSNVLRCILEAVLSNTSEESFPQQILKTLNAVGESATKSDERTIASLRNRLEPLISDINCYGMSKKTWSDFFAESKPIIVLHTNSISLDNNHQIIDMMLTTLFNYQNEDFSVSLDIFIDEIQNQNFSSTSSIRKIMKEGRKIHMAFFGSTQDYYPKKTELGRTMGKAGTQIFLRPSQDSEQAVAAELRWKKADIARFDSMDRGDIIVKGALYNKKNKRNTQTTLSGHVDDFLSWDTNDEPDEDAEMTEDDC